jgi:nucleoid DNA-binding protein
MNKNDIIDALTAVLSTRKESRDAVEKMFGVIAAALRDGDKVVVAGFGSFHPFVARAKRGRNPRTGQSIQLAPRRKIRFRQAKDFFETPPAPALSQRKAGF